MNLKSGPASVHLETINGLFHLIAQERLLVNLVKDC